MVVAIFIGRLNCNCISVGAFVSSIFPIPHVLDLCVSTAFKYTLILIHFVVCTFKNLGNAAVMIKP